MTNAEVTKILTDARRLINTMDKAHITNLLKILLDALPPKDSVSFLFIDIKKTTKRMLNDLIKQEHVNDCLSRKNMKQIFEILGDYKVYPVCSLCGKPIKIDTNIRSGDNQYDKMAFSWDHIRPKSKGGGYYLANMQPAHKICNNKRGTRPLYSKHYKLKIDIDIEIEAQIDSDSGRVVGYRPVHFGLRKQDSWCHKQCCQRHR